MKVYLLMESYCGDPFSVLKIFSTEEVANAYMEGLLKLYDNRVYNSYIIRVMRVEE